MEFRRHLRRVGTLLVTTAVACVAMMGGAFASTAFATDDDILFSGTTSSVSEHQSETCDWSISKDGELVVRPTNGSSGYIAGYEPAWEDRNNYIRSARFEGTVSIADRFCRVFSGCNQLKTIDLKGLNTFGVTSLNGFFAGCSNLLTIKSLDTLNMNDVISIDSMFEYCSSLPELDLSTFSMSKITNMNNVFHGCSNLKTVNLPKLDHSSVSNMSGAFSNCTSLTEISFANFDTTNVTTARALFSGCSSLESVKDFKGGKLDDISWMFSGCSSLKSLSGIEFSNFDTSLTTTFSGLFNACSSLTEIDITDKVTAYVNNFSTVFAGCSSLKTIKGLESIDARNITNIENLFSGCSSLEEIDLSAFKRQYLCSDTTSLFSGCSSLKTIYADDSFAITPSQNYWAVFDGCDNLIGGKGTSYSAWVWKTDEIGNKYLSHPSEHASVVRARIDGGPDSDTPGYFTEKGEAPHVHALIDWSTKSSCTQSGYKDGKQCSECETIVDRGIYISSRNHTRPDTYIVENEVEATDDTDGSYDKVWRCTVCNEIIRSQHIIIKSKSFLYPTHTLDGTVIPNDMLFKNLDKKKLTDNWTKEEALFCISQSICLMNETNDADDDYPSSWDRSYVSEESAAKLAYLCFLMYDGQPAWELAYSNHYRCCSPKDYEGCHEDDDKYYGDNHTDHYAESWYGNAAWAGMLLDKYYSTVNISQDAAFSVLAGDVVWHLNTYDHLGNLLLRAFPNGATTAQLGEIGTGTLCNAISYSVPCKELKTNSALYKTIGDYIIANANGSDQIAVANKIMLERNAGSDGSSSGSSSSGGSSSGSSISGGESGGGASSSEVNALKSEIASLKAELEKLKKASGDTETIATLQKTIASLEKNLDAMSASLAQTQNALTLSEMPRKISKNIKRAVGSKVKIALPTSASGAKVAFKPASNKHLKITKSGGATVLKALKRGKTYTIRVTVTCGDQTKEIALKLKAK